MISWIGLFIMAIGAVAVMIDSDYQMPWAKEPPKVEAIKVDPMIGMVKELASNVSGLVDVVAKLSVACDAQPLKLALEQLSNKHSALEKVIESQKPPAMPDIHFPDKLEVSIVEMPTVNLEGGVSVSTPKGERLRVLHRQAAPNKPKPKVDLSAIKTQIDGLSK